MKRDACSAPAENQDRINALHREGWQFVFLSPDARGGIAYFIRDLAPTYKIPMATRKVKEA